MNKNDLKSYYLKFVYIQTNSFDDDVKTFIHKISDIFLTYIIDYSLNYSCTLNEIEYDKVFEITEATIDKSKDVDFMLYVLSLKPYNAIEWIHYFESDDFFEPKREYLTGKELIEIKKNGEYYNPLTGCDVTKDVFYQKLCTVFGTTQDFKNKIKAMKREAV